MMKDDERAVFERPFGKVEPGHGSDPEQPDLLARMKRLHTRRDNDFAARRALPETTTVPGRSAAHRHCASKRSGSIGSTIQTAGLPSIWVSALAGIEIPGPVSSSRRPVTVAPSRIGLGVIDHAILTRNVRVTGSACGSTVRTRAFAVTDGSSVKVTVIVGSGGAARSTWAGTSNTASRPSSRAT